TGNHRRAGSGPEDATPRQSHILRAFGNASLHRGPLRCRPLCLGRERRNPAVGRIDYDRSTPGRENLGPALKPGLVICLIDIGFRSRSTAVTVVRFKHPPLECRSFGCGEKLLTRKFATALKARQGGSHPVSEKVALARCASP